jgi:ABC-2 type transport system ATP-binding protein
MSAAVAIEGLSVRRGKATILPEVSLSVAAGAVTGLLGPSGSGKTTLMRAIVGVQRIAAGSVEVLGLPAGDRRLRSRVGYVTQAPSIYGDLTVEENLQFFARVLNAESSQVAFVLGTVGMSELAGRVVSQLSGGERARVSLATAMLNAPELLVLDEPTVGLDPVLRRDLWATFRQIAQSGGTLLVSSHVMEEASHCDQLLLMREGRILAATTPSALLLETKQPDLDRAFLAIIEANADAA